MDNVIDLILLIFKLVHNSFFSSFLLEAPGGGGAGWGLLNKALIK